MGLDGTGSVPVDGAWVLQGCVLELLLFILYTSELFHIFENHMVGHADDSTIHAVIPIPLSLCQVMKS